MTYLITFACYGCRLHGDDSGSVDHRHTIPRTPTVDPSPSLVAADRERMDQAPYHLDSIRRDAVLGAIEEVCAHRGWELLAAHVRSNHVHVVVVAEAQPEKVMNDFKAYASRRLNEIGLDRPGRKRWACHGSTRWLWTPTQVSAAMRYVVSEQGESMAVFQAAE